jgi:predicted MFS family arabinose efflux permease
MLTGAENHPILNILAEDFDVSYEKASLVPTLMQAGYAAGLLLLCPLGDLFKRRPFVLILVWFTGTLWSVLAAGRVVNMLLMVSRIGLCITKSFNAFCAMSLLVAVTTVTPQLMLPLVGDLAPLHRRATALSIVSSGMLFGMLIARVLSGIVTQYTSWRIIYWIAFGLQYLILILLYLYMPDYPSTNPGGLNYFRLLWSIVTIAFKSPVLIQACLIGFCTSSIFTNFWTTLTFLLAEPPYSYEPLIIGCFGFIGIGAMCFGPVYSRFVIDRFVPLFSVITGLCMCMVGTCVGTYIGSFSIAGPVIQAFVIDLGLQVTQISNRSAIFSIAPKARNRVNTAYMVSIFCGQLAGTAIGNTLFARGGWVRSGSASVAFVGAALIVAFVHGPWEKGWIGWGGGWGIRRRDLGPKKDEGMGPKTEDGAIAEDAATEPVVRSEDIEKEAETTERSSNKRHPGIAGEKTS